MLSNSDSFFALYNARGVNTMDLPAYFLRHVSVHSEKQVMKCESCLWKLRNVFISANKS